MDRKNTWMCVLVVTAAISFSGCGNEPKPGQIVIGDPNVVQNVSKQVKITSQLETPIDVWGQAPALPPNMRRGLLALSSPYNNSNKIFGLNGQWIEFRSTAEGFSLVGSNNAYEGKSLTGGRNFRAYPLTTSNPGLRLWLIEGPNILPSEIWVIGETEEGLQCYVTPEDFKNAGISVENPGKEHISVEIKDGSLVIGKSHMDQVTQSEGGQGKARKPAKVTWKQDKSVTVGWDDSSQTFKIGSAASSSSGGFMDSISAFFSGSSISENKIESIEKEERIIRALPTDTKSCDYTVETSNGKKIVFSAYRNYFRVLSEDGSTAYYTSEPRTDAYGRFLISEIKVSDPDTRLWSVTFDTGGTTRSYSGYWLIGEHKGVLKVYLTAEDMDAAGLPLADSKNTMKRKGAHVIYLKTVDGRIQGDYAYEYWSSNVSHAAAKTILDKTFTIAWDKKAQSFQVMDVKESEPMYIPRGKDPSEVEWTPLEENDLKRLRQALKFK